MSRFAKQVSINTVGIIIAIMSLFIIPVQLHAQNIQDTLTEVHIKDKRSISNDTRINDFSPGQKIKIIDSITLQQYRQQSIASLLSQQVPVFIKSYGFNSLATLSFRGASAAQSQVLWNGVPIQNAALGIADVSTLPVLFADRLDVVYGSSSALWGSGNVGGALLIENNKPVFDSNVHSLSIMAGGGSFGQYQGGLKAALSTGRWYFAVKALAQTAVNDFPYTDLNNERKNTNNALLQSGSIQAEAAYEIAPQNVISLYAWYQQYNREIPAALFEDISTKKQTDGSLRILLDWNKKHEGNNWYAKASLIRDYINYRDDTIKLISSSTTYQYYAEAGWGRDISQHSKLLVFVPLQLSAINILQETKQQTKAAIAGAYEVNYFEQRLHAAINARGEVINNQTVFLPGADASFAITNWLAVRANAQHTYRAPTLNELYYNPGGNPDLKPEQGWNEDAGYTIKWNNNKWSLYHDASVFNRLIKNWIIWLGGAIWTPHNIAEVHSRGIETENKLEWKSGQWAIHIGVNTAYTLSTTQTSYIVNDGSVGKQIPYTPRYNGQLNIGFSYKSFYFNYNHTYTGYRFITSDESEYLTPYQTGNVQLMYNTFIAQHSVQLTAQCNNIWNQDYQVVAYRPMPGINWLAGLSVQLIR